MKLEDLRAGGRGGEGPGGLIDVDFVGEVALCFC
jgi:hypothetical protein